VRLLGNLKSSLNIGDRPGETDVIVPEHLSLATHRRHHRHLWGRYSRFVVRHLVRCERSLMTSDRHAG
jgi:hypothetical protein